MNRIFLFNLFLGISLASSKLRKRYIDDLVKIMINQPLSKCDNENIKINREDFHVDLTVLDSSEVEKEFSSSDRDYLIEKKFEERGNIKPNEIIKEGDEAVYIRGVGGTGKTTLLEMFTLRWAKKSFEGK